MERVVANSRSSLMLVVWLLVAGCSSAMPSPSPTPLVADASSVSSNPAATPTPAPTSTPSPTPAASATPIPTPVPTPRPVAAAWKEVPKQTSVRDVQMLDVVWTGTRFAAVGWGAFMDSTDGVTWHRHGTAVGEGGSVRMAAGRAGVVTVGGSSSWTSSDGLSWTAHPKAFPSSGARGGSVVVTDVVADGKGWLAVGRQDPPCMTGCRTDPTRAWVWTSTDGIHWTRVADQPAFKGGGMDAVAADDAGFVAAGNASGHVAIWTSPDGLTWTRVPDDAMFHGKTTSTSAATGVAVRDGATVVVGMTVESDPPRARAWWSVDRKTWSQATVDKAVGGQIFDVASTIDGFLATGPSGGASCLGGIWASSDGHAWRCVASAVGFHGFGPYAAAASDTVEVAVGLTDAGYAENSDAGLPGAVWYRTWS